MKEMINCGEICVWDVCYIDQIMFEQGGINQMLLGTLDCLCSETKTPW